MYKSKTGVSIPLDSLRLPPRNTVSSPPELPVIKKAARVIPQVVTPRMGFIKGPIDLDWIIAVQRLPGKVPLQLALALKHQQGLSKTNPVRLTTKLLEKFELSKRSVYDALKALTEAGLVSVEAKPGVCRMVTILDSYHRG